MRLVSIHKHLFLIAVFVLGWLAPQAQVWSLQQCLDTAQVYNRTLQISRNLMAISEQKQKEVKANFNPRITANADYRYFTDLPYQLMPQSVFGGPEGTFKETQFGVPHNINASVQFTMPLYSPSLHGAVQSTRIASELASWQYQKTEEQIYVEISHLYYSAQILWHQLAFIDRNLVNAQKLLANMQLLREQLMAKGTDVSKVQLQVSQLRTQRESIGSKREQVLHALQLAMGMDIAQSLDIDPAIQQQTATNEAGKPIVDIRLAETQYQLLSSELRTLKSSRLPTASLFGTYGATGFGYDKAPRDFLKFFPVGFAGVQVQYPLFDGTSTKWKIRQKTLEIQNSHIHLHLLSEQNNMQVENAKLQRTVAQASMATTLEQVELAQEIYEQTLVQQKNGTAALSDVLLADTDLREAQNAYLSFVVEFLKADLELKRATGNILSTQ